MRSPGGRQWPGKARLFAAVAGLDWTRATLSRTSEHLRLAGQEESTGPVLRELRSISTRLAALHHQVEEAALKPDE